MTCVMEPNEIYNWIKFVYDIEGLCYLSFLLHSRTVLITQKNCVRLAFFMRNTFSEGWEKMNMWSSYSMRKAKYERSVNVILFRWQNVFYANNNNELDLYLWEKRCFNNQLIDLLLLPLTSTLHSCFTLPEIYIDHFELCKECACTSARHK